MTVTALNEKLAAGTERAFKLTRQFEQAYLTVFQEAAHRAARRFEEIAVPASVTAATNPGWTPPSPDDLVAEAAVAAELEAATAKLRRRALRAVTQEAARDLEISFDITNPMAEQLLAQVGERAGDVTATVKQELTRITQDAYRQGLSVENTAKQIWEAADPGTLTGSQAHALARTDLNMVANGASLRLAKAATAVPFKQWVTASDDRVRDMHVDAHGQTVPIDQPFSVGGEALQHPGDPAGSAANVFNCRCAIVYTDSPPAVLAAAAPEGEPMSDSVSAAAVTITVDEGPDAEAVVESRWVSDIAFEGTATVDGRYMLPDALTWREPPLTLMAMTETGPGGHEGAFAAGRMDTFEKDAERDMNGEPLEAGVTAVRSGGIFDANGEEGGNVARLVDERIVRGISVDLAIDEWLFRDPETGDLIEPDEMTEDDWERVFLDELQFAIRKATILAATVCPTPAFDNARIEVLVASGGGYTANVPAIYRLWTPIVPQLVGEAGAVTAAAALAPAKPPREWFETSEPPGPMPLTITDDGRVFGHIADWTTCHTSFGDRCLNPPRSRSNYSYFHVGELETAEGDRLAVGKLMLGSKHAPLSNSRMEASQHYDDNGTVGAYVRAIDGQHGIWVCGALRHNLDADRLRDFRANPPSGDWRPVNGHLELVAALAVPVPGFPIPRFDAGLVASAGEVEVTALIASAGQIVPTPEVLTALADAGISVEFVALPDEAEARRRMSVLAAAASDDPIREFAELAAVSD